ncbi:MAG: hypothetical protein HC804_10665 [Anaerolineae bacterium]|nr:hypothetical protein [Anaerolineae bacterium]
MSITETAVGNDDRFIFDLVFGSVTGSGTGFSQRGWTVDGRSAPTFSKHT